MDTRIALRYAKAVFNLAKQEKKEETIQNELSLFTTTIEANPDLEEALKSPVIKPKQKVAILKSIFTGIHQINKGLFDVLSKNNRVGLLTNIAKKYEILYDFEKATDTAVIATAIPVNNNFLKLLKEKITSLTGKKLKLIQEVNPEIIGGFILRLGDVQYDASISKKLNDLKQMFDNSNFIAKI